MFGRRRLQMGIPTIRTDKEARKVSDKPLGKPLTEGRHAVKFREPGRVGLNVRYYGTARILYKVRYS
jgi:hypothetical protein